MDQRIFFERPAGAYRRPAAAPLDIALGIHRLLPRGGLEDNCLRIADHLRQRGHRVTIFVGGERPCEHDVPIVSLAPARPSVFNHVRAARFAEAFIAATAGRFDRTISFQPIPGADVLFLADRLRDRAALNPLRWVHPRLHTYASLEHGCFRRGAKTRIIGLADAQMAEFVARYGTEQERIAIAPPTLSCEKHRPESRTPEARRRLRNELSIDHHAPVWLWLALQPRVKGLDRVFAALARQPNAFLLVGGLEPQNRKTQLITAEAERLGVADRIRWLGYVGSDRFHDCMAASDALVHPARLEVTGAVILEAIVNGLPVVATGICGFAPHIERSGAGKVLRKPFDAAEFDACLAEVTGLRNSRLSAAGIAYGRRESLFSGTAFACELIEADSWAEPREDALPLIESRQLIGPARA